MIGVNVIFDYDGDFDRSRVVEVAENARGMFEGMPGLRLKVFTPPMPLHGASFPSRSSLAPQSSWRRGRLARSCQADYLTVGVDIDPLGGGI
jgi:hypothetical protein